MDVLFVPSQPRLNGSFLFVERQEGDIIKAPNPDRKGSRLLSDTVLFNQFSF